MQSTVNMMGYLWLEGKAISQMTLSSVREVFRHGTENDVDPGITSDGIEYVPVGKGTVVYTDRGAERTAGDLVRRTFFFKGDSSRPQSGESFRNVVDGDFVKWIEMNNERSSTAHVGD